MAYKDANFVVVATPTNYDPDTNGFDTSSVDEVVKDKLELSAEAFLVISPLSQWGIQNHFKKRTTDRVIFSPEFLREGQALKDNLCISDYSG